MTEADIGRKTVFDQIYIVFTSLLVIPFIDKLVSISTPFAPFLSPITLKKDQLIYLASLIPNQFS